MSENPYWAERAADLDFKSLTEAIEEALWNPFQDAHFATFKAMKRRGLVMSATEAKAKRILKAIRSDSPPTADDLAEIVWDRKRDISLADAKTLKSGAPMEIPSSDASLSWEIWHVEAAAKLILDAAASTAIHHEDEVMSPTDIDGRMHDVNHLFAIVEERQRRQGIDYNRSEMIKALVGLWHLTADLFTQVQAIQVRLDTLERPPFDGPG